MEQITSRLHLLTAVNQALLAKATQTLRTKTVHSEVLWELEPGTNVSHSQPASRPRSLTPAGLFKINDSLKHFGLGPSTTSLLLVKIAPMPDTRGTSPKEERAVHEAMLALVDRKSVV